MTAAARPTVSVFSHTDATKSTSTTALPDVFTVPIRPDVVNFIHSQMAKNKRQAYAVKYEAGMDTAAESWGTGRAVSRIPRVPGGGTHRAGQGAFGNMCRGGRMFAPTKIWRKWHRRIATNQRRYAVVSALAATAVPALVMARGHRVDEVPELPLVLGSEVESVAKTKDAVEILKKFGLEAEIKRVEDSKKVRAGKGKARGRKYVQRKGPLVVYSTKDASIYNAFRNIPGVDLLPVNELNLLKLAPGGHVGRMVIWTQNAFDSLDEVFESKKDFALPRSAMSNADLGRLVNSDEVQKVVRAKANEFESVDGGKKRKRNPLKNASAMKELNPYAETQRRKSVAEGGLKTPKVEKENATTKAQRTAFFNKMME